MIMVIKINVCGIRMAILNNDLNGVYYQINTGYIRVHNDCIVCLRNCLVSINTFCVSWCWRYLFTELSILKFLQNFYDISR